MAPSSSYQSVLRDLYARTNRGIKLGLEVTEQLLDALGRPQERLRCVLVAGTNGKGSTTWFIAEALRHAGHRVGFYCSPHLVRFTERIRIDGAEIVPERVVALAQVIAHAEPACARPPSFFECVTAMALHEFERQNVDVAVLEVGLGGRLDATNVVRKELAVITPIDFDHQAFLGNTLPLIAAEKAAILPLNGVGVIAPQATDAMAVIEATAAQRNTTLHRVPPPTETSDTLTVTSGLTLSLPPGLPPYQHINVATAATACLRLDAAGITCPGSAIRRAAQEFSWRGRYQWLDGAPPTLIDGAHNVAGVKVLRAALASDARLAGRPIHCVFSARRDKDPQALLDVLSPHITTVHSYVVRSERAASADELRALNPAPRFYGSAQEALAGARDRAHRDGGVVLACGSLLVAGDVLALCTGERRDPPVDG